MRFRKVYGQSKIDNCPFCERQATTTSSQGIPVCQQHKNSILNEFKCICGDWLELQTGKYGAYFRCHQCGNINFKKALEINIVKDVSKPVKETKPIIKKKIVKKPIEDYSLKKQEEIVMPGDPRYFD